MARTANEPESSSLTGDVVMTKSGEASDDSDHEVWQSFEQSVAYMRNLSALYKDAFLIQPNHAKPASVTTAHIEAAKGHAREAVELLASNLLNSSAAVVAQMENQDEQLAALNEKLDKVKDRLRERQEDRDQQVLQRFRDINSADKSQRSSNGSSINSHDVIPEPSSKLKLSLAAPSTTSATASSYLYL